MKKQSKEFIREFYSKHPGQYDMIIDVVETLQGTSAARDALYVFALETVRHS